MSNKETEPGKDAAETARTGVYRTLRAIVLLPFNFLLNFLSMPGLSIIGARIWKGLAKRSLYGYHKAAGGDRVGLINKPGGQIELRAVKYKTAAEADDETPAGWHAKGRDKHWKPSTFGNSGPRLGKTPVIPLDSESWRATSTLEARVAEAVDQGKTRPLYRVDEAELTATIDARGANTAAVTDGGMQVDDIRFNPRTSPIFDDTIIELGADDADGMAVSWAKAKELMRERTTTDEMDRQEQRGLLAGMSRKDIKSLMLKLMLIAGAIALGGLIGPEIVAAVLGGGGGGGGSGGGIVPIFLGLI